MTRENFLNELKQALCGMKEDEIESVLAYYSEMLDDRVEAGMTEEDAVNAMEPVQAIAQRVLSEAGVEQDEEKQKDDAVKEIRKSAEEVTELIVTASNQRVRITCTDSDEIVLRYRIEDGDIYQLHEENGQVTLEHTLRPVSSYKFDASKVTVDKLFDEVGKFLKGLNFSSLIQLGNTGSRCIEVMLPRVFKGKLTVHTGNSRITAENVTCMDEMRLQTANARIILKQIVAPSIYAGTSNSRIVLEDVYVREQLDAVTSNGRISARGVVSDKMLQLRTSNSRIEMENVSAQDITLKTSNGSIMGSIKGVREDFSIASSTSNGHNNLCNCEAGEKSLVAKTSNGNIDIAFVS